MAGGLLCVVIGVTVMVAWFSRATAILRFGSQTPMAFSTALAVAVTGAALVALVRGRPRAALAAGLFDAAFGAVVLAEYALGRGLGIDQLAVRAYISGPHGVPGRPTINTAVCLTLVGAALLVWAPWRSRRRPIGPAAAGSFIGAAAVTAIIGYATGAPAAAVWLHLTAMAFLTAVVMLILALSLLSAAWRDTPRQRDGPPKWLPMPAAMTAFALAAVAWLAIVGRGAGARYNADGAATNASTTLGFLMAGLVLLVVWLAQQADERRRMAVAEAARRARAEAATRDSEKRLFQFLDAMPVGVFVATPGGRPYYANGEAERLLGRGVVADIGASQLAETYDAFVAGTDRHYPAESVPVVRALHGQPSHIDDMEIRKPGGDVIPIEVWGRPLRGADGEVSYGLAVFADLSDRQASERTVADQAALLELAHDAILVRDRDGRIVFWNAGAERTYGFARDAAVGRISNEILCTRFPEPLADIEARMAAGGRWNGELVHQCADGRIITVESRWVAQCGPDGSPLRILEINRDITARKEAEREALRRAGEVQTLNATLEQQVRQRTMHLARANNNLRAFGYSIAHDLRTPLRAMSGFAEILAEEYADCLGETGREYAGRIQSATAQMGALIDDLMHLSQVTQAEMNPQEVDLTAEVTAICDQLRAGDPDRRVRTTVEDGVRVTADRSLILVVLGNLLQNAWKFTTGRDEASIEFGTVTVDDAPVCCYVRDNGAGFNSSYADKLFQPFQRLHDTGKFPAHGTANGSGTGIGLASVQRIIERHGGRTWAEGSVDHGATFYFTIDATPPGGFEASAQPG